MIDLFKRPEPPYRAPEPIRDLIAAINDKARAAQTGLFTMLAVGIYIIATSFSTTDLDLLMEKSTPIAQLGVQIPVVVSFAIAPVVFFALHAFTLIRFDLLAFDIQAFADDLALAKISVQDRARCQRLLANTEFVQILSAPRDSRRRSPFVSTVAWFLIAVFPVAVLSVAEISALRLQDLQVTFTQQAALALDLGLLFWFLCRRFSRSPDAFGRKLNDLFAKAATAAVGLGLFGLALCHYAAVPNSSDKTVAEGRAFRDSHAYSMGGTVLGNMRRQPLDLVLCPYLHWGCRYLSVEHRLIVSQIWDKSAIVKLRVKKQPAKYLAAIDGAYLARRHLLFADFAGSRLYAANLFLARLQGADLAGAKMQGADLVGAKMQGADLRDALMQGAALDNAWMQGAYLRGSQQYGASGIVYIRLADLRHADFTTRADGESRAQLAKIAAIIGTTAHRFPGVPADQWRASLKASQRRLRAAEHAGAPLPTYEAAPRSVLVVIRGRHGRRPFPPRLRPFVTDDGNAYSRRLAEYFATHVASWGPAAAARIAKDRALDAGPNPTPRQRAIGCALRSANKASFAGYEEILDQLKKAYPQSVCHPSATPSPNTATAHKAPEPAARHAAN